MNILLDTHITVWGITDDKRLNRTARNQIPDPGNDLYHNAVSVLEIDMKTKSRRNNLEFSVRLL